MSRFRILCLLVLLSLVVTCQNDRGKWGANVETTSEAVVGVANALGPNQSIALNQSIQSLNGRYELTLKNDGDIVLTNVAKAKVWSSATQSTPALRLTMQGDGNLVLMSTSNGAIWTTGTSGNPGARLVVGNDGAAKIYGSDGREIWSTATQLQSVMVLGQMIRTGQSLTSSNRRYTLLLQQDGDLVLTRNADGAKIWSTGTSGRPANRLLLQGDGNLVLAPDTGSATWTSGTGGSAATWLLLRDDGNLTLLMSSRLVVWQTNTTSPPWRYMFPYLGSGVPGPYLSSGPGGGGPPAPLEAQLNRPSSIAASFTGERFVADAEHNLILHTAESYNYAYRWDFTQNTSMWNSANLLVNPSAEAPSGTSGWQSAIQGSTWRAARLASCSPPCPPEPFDGVHYFGPSGSIADAELYQDAPLLVISDIDSGNTKVTLNGYVRSPAYSVDGQDLTDTARIVGQFLDANKQPIASSFVDSGNLARSSEWKRVNGTAVAPAGTRYVRVRLIAHRVKPSGGISAFFDGLSVVAFDARRTEAQTMLNNPQALITYDTQSAPSNALIVADTYNHRIVTLAGNNHWYTTVAGVTGSPNGALTRLHCPRGIARRSDGSLLIADYANHRVMLLSSLVGGTMSVFAGTGDPGMGLGDGLATQQSLYYPSAVAVRGSNAYIADRGNHTVWKVSSSGIISRFAGLLYPSTAGDGGPAVDAGLELPDALAIGPDGSLYIADSGHHAIRRVKSGIITTVAGKLPTQSSFGNWSEYPGSTGDGGPSLAARLNQPAGLFVQPVTGELFIADRENHRVRVLRCGDQDACNGTEGFSTSTGECTAGTPPTVNDLDSCTQDTCDSGTGVITHTPITLDDGDGCTVDTCSASGGVKHTAKAAGTACDDENPCTSGDVCLAGSALCQGTVVPVPNDSNPCTVDACDPVSGASPMPNEGASCSPAGCQPGTGCERVCGASGTCEQPPPVLVAPLLDPTGATPLAKAIEFLHKQPVGIQVGVAAGTIKEDQAALVSGRVTMPNGEPLSNVTVSFANAPEFGSTRTRVDGRYDLAVNGRPNFALRFEKALYFSTDRTISVPWNETKTVEDVILKHADKVATTVSLGAGSMQEAESAFSEDEDGKRQVVVMVPPNTTADVQLDDGSSVPLDNMKLRMTEYTVGESGPAAMPGPLPPTTAYTYAVEISADEAIAQQSATSVKFNQALPVYVDNYLNVPVGQRVPAGYYDKEKAAWVSAENGLVVGVKDVVGGMARLDADGDNDADTTDLALLDNPSTQELTLLGARYKSGESLWRVPVRHLTPWDFNWPKGPPPCETQQGIEVCPAPGGSGASANTPICGSTRSGSIIGCEGQSLGETLPLAGTPYTLNYDSSREPGYAGQRQIKLSLTGPKVHSRLIAVEIAISIAGQRNFWKVDSPSPNTTALFTWNGLDGFGRPVVGTEVANVVITSVYPAIYYSAEQFASFSSQPGLPMMAEDRRMNVIRYPTEFSVELFGRTPRDGWSLGGWTLSAHHFFDPRSGYLYFGDGSRRRTQPDGYLVRQIGGGGSGWAADGSNALNAEFLTDNVLGGGGVTVAPNGDVYIADSGHRVVRRISAADGKIRTVAGMRDDYACQTSSGPSLNDGGPPTSARLYVPLDVAFGPDGSLYITDGALDSIRRISPDGQTIETVAGASDCSGRPGYSGDGGPATAAELNNPMGITVASDGSVYFADSANNVIRKIDPAGIITTVAGNGQSGGEHDNVPARSASLGFVQDVAIGPDGTLYIPLRRELVSVQTDGVARVLNASFSVNTRVIDGVALSTQAIGDFCALVSADPITGNVLYADTDIDRLAQARDSLHRWWLRELDPLGIVRNVSAGIENTVAVDGALALQQGPAKYKSIATGANGTVAVYDDHRVYMLERLTSRGTVACNNPAARYILPAADEAYCFDEAGRHLSTLNLHTQQQIRSFLYANGELDRVVESGNTTLVQRAADRYTIAGPFGQTTTLGRGANGYLAYVEDAAGRVTLTHLSNGLLDYYKDKRGTEFDFGYDPVGGLLTTDRGGVGSSWDTTQTLARTFLPTGHRVEHWTPQQRKTVYDTFLDTNNLYTQVTTEPDGTSVKMSRTYDGVSVRKTPDGTVTTVVVGPSKRFGMQRPLAANATIATPSGLTLNVATADDAVLADPLDPMTMVSESRTKTVGGATWRSDFNLASRREETKSPGLRRVWTTYDTAGRVTKIEVPGMTALDISYNRGRVETINLGPRQTSFAYDTGGPSNGYLGSATNARNEIISFIRDSLGRATSETQGAFTTGFGWDANDNLTTITPSGRPSHAQTFNVFDVLKTYDPPNLSGISNDITTFSMTDDRAPENEWRQGTQVLQREYDPQGRLWKSTRGTKTATFSYYPSGSVANGAAPGNVKTISGPYSVNLAFSYDGVLPTKVAWSGDLVGSVGWSYDSSFLPVRETVTAGATVQCADFAYDLDGYFICARQSSACGATPSCSTALTDSLVLTRHPDNGLLTESKFGNVKETFTYNSFGELATQTATYGSTTLVSITYDDNAQYPRDVLGRVARRTETVLGSTTKTTDFTYDSRGQLTDITQGGAVVEHVEYDGNGNRSKYTGFGQSNILPSVDAQDRLLVFGNVAFQYQSNGEAWTKTRTTQQTTQQWTYTYDSAGSLISVVLPTGVTIDYVVDALGRRVAKKVGGVIQKRWLYRDAMSPVAELDGAGALVAQFVYGGRPNVPEYVRRGTKTYKVISDQLGSPRYVVNVNDLADVPFRADYSAFGVVAPLSGTNVNWMPFGFAGGFYDSDTGLVRFGARDYDPEVGRWLSKDPILFDAAQPNLYVYVRNDPINSIDPTGLLEGVPDWLEQWDNSGGLQDTGDFFAGMSSSLTFGLSDYLIDASGLGKYGSKCSGAYEGGSIAGAGVALLGGPAIRAAKAARAATGPLRAWVRVKGSYSKILERPTTASITWGSNEYHRAQIGSATLRALNRSLRNSKLPINGWRAMDPGHFHVWW
jgi:RHS repeat-associated protein